MSNSASIEYPHPLFGSSYGQNFRDWLANWTLDLLDKVKEERAVKVFRACSLVFKDDSNLVLFLLPRILVCALADADKPSRDQVWPVDAGSMLKGSNIDSGLGVMFSICMFALLYRVCHNKRKILII